MTVVHTYFYIVVDTQRGCHTLKFESFCYRESRKCQLLFNTVLCIISL